METIIAFAVGVILLGIVLKIVALPFKFLKWFITNSVAGALLLWLVALLGVPVKINIVSALIAGALGLPGVLIIIAYTYL